MKQFNWTFYILLLFAPLVASAHHYKGLPHYSYFENYPQVPYLEFIKKISNYEIYITVYNFQGLNLKQVESPDMVRFYIYIFDLDEDKVYKDSARFKIISQQKLIHDTGIIPSEQENIFIIQKKIEEQSDLVLQVEFENKNGEMINAEIPFQITKTFFQKYGVYLSIGLFFLIVMTIKTISNKVNAPLKRRNEVSAGERT